MEQEKSVLNSCPRVTVVTVKISPSDFADLPAPDFNKAFCNTLSAGDGNFRGDGKSLERVTVDWADFGRFERGSEQNRVTTRPTRLKQNLSRF